MEKKTSPSVDDGRCYSFAVLNSRLLFSRAAELDAVHY